jgi:hypothetical protein
MKPAHEHSRTLLKVPRTNVGSIGGASAVALAVALLGYIAKSLLDGSLPVPPEYRPYALFAVGVLMILATWLGGIGVPSLHPEMPATEVHHGPLVPPGTEP